MDGVPIVPWSSLLVDYLGLTSNDYFNSGVSGAGWVAGGTTFLQQLQNLNSAITNKEQITDIVVMGGINDMDNTANVMEAIGTFSTYVKTNYPNALITIGVISWAKNKSVRQKLITLMKYYENASVNSNVRVVSNAYTWFHNYKSNFRQPDGHPASNGSVSIAYHLANFLKNGINHVVDEESITISNANSQITGTASTFGTLRNIMNGNQVSMQISIPTLRNLTMSTFDLMSSYILGTIDSAFIFGDYEDNIILGSGSGWAYNGTYHFFDFTLNLINGNQLQLKLMSPENTTISNVTILSFNPVPVVTLPTEIC